MPGIAPLLDVSLIKERQEAINDLLKNADVIDYFQDQVKKLPDLERNFNRIYNSINRQKLKTFKAEEQALAKLRDLLDLFKELKILEGVMQGMQQFVSGINFKSKYLKKICSFTKESKDREKIAKIKQSYSEQIFNSKIIQEEEGEEKPKPKKSKQKQKNQDDKSLFPNLSIVIEELEDMIEFKNELPLPKEGYYPHIDDLVIQIQMIKDELSDILAQMRKKFRCDDISFVSCRQDYELEIPVQIIEKKKPEDFILTSKRKGYMRYHTTEIEEKVEKLQDLQVELKHQLIPFMISYFKLFFNRDSFWRKAISIASQLDCLCSMAKFAQGLDIRCKPEILPLVEQDDLSLTFDLQDMAHPLLNQSLEPGQELVRNCLTVKDGKTSFLITGPNMGGKSTLLRQTAIAVILAQMGSYVPARSFKLTAIDRIFTRIGAFDDIIQSKSTFFIEMEETLNIVTEATRNSLLIIDELGRGTSTYDGLSIAYATLKHVVERVDCLTLFATHYHQLIEEFKLFDNVVPYYMLSYYNEETDVVEFKYKFIYGMIEKSHGFNVAKMAGIPMDVIKRGKAKEKQLMQAENDNGKNKQKKVIFQFNGTLLKLNELENQNLSQILKSLEKLMSL